MDAPPPTDLRRGASHDALTAASASALATPTTELRRSQSKDSAPAPALGPRRGSAWGFMGLFASPATSDHGSGGTARPLSRREEDAERDYLEAEVQKRDRTVAELERANHDLQRDVDRAKAKFDGLRRRQLEETYLRKVEVARRKREYRSLQARAKVYKRDMEDRDSLLGYAELIREAAPKSIDSSYVMRLQSQLAKATKKMEAMHGQMDLVQTRCDEVMDSLRAEIGEVIEEKCRIEVEMVDSLKLLRAEKNGAEEGYREQLEIVESRLKKLRRKEEGGDGDDNECNEDGNEEKQEVVVKKTKAEEAKALRERVDRIMQEREESEAELRHILRDRREQITRLQQESELFGESMRKMSLH